MKIQLGDVTIVIEPEDDPKQVIAIANALGGKDAPKTNAVVAEGDSSAAPSRKHANRCKGRGKCDGLYHASEAKYQRNFMCDTYEYVASYKNGRTSRQAAEWAHIKQAAMSQRLITLMRLGLLDRNGRVYVSATS